MKEKIYWIIRLLIVGFGIGGLITFTVNRMLGIGWIIGYTLCWVFSPKASHNKDSLKSEKGR